MVACRKLKSQKCPITPAKSFPLPKGQNADFHGAQFYFSIQSIKLGVFKGPVHQLDMYVLIKGHCRRDQNVIGHVTFESQGKEKSAYLF